MIPAVVTLYLAASTVAFVAYGMDKAAAVGGARRIPERWLHLLGLAGGWPGGLLAQRVFRHKCSKGSFQVVFWCSVAGNVLCTVALFSGILGLRLVL